MIKETVITNYKVETFPPCLAFISKQNNLMKFTTIFVLALLGLGALGVKVNTATDVMSTEDTLIALQKTDWGKLAFSML